jgi:hypothetical protein
VIRKLCEIARCSGQGIIKQPFFLSFFIFFPDTNPKSIAIKRKKGQAGSTYSRLTNQLENLTMVGNTHHFFISRGGEGAAGGVQM